MRSNKLSAATLGMATLLLLGAPAYAEKFSTTFTGFEEIGGLGAGETAKRGQFSPKAKARLIYGSTQKLKRSPLN